ncbi:MAG: N-formylglutamate amidohydrolase [Alphaproteobacteria bacterium]|nr:N-formylglutamate amidohydrolase [Alphaproteobacteria bacterium]
MSSLEELAWPCRVLAPAGDSIPAVLSVPHAGRHYPRALLTEARLERAILRGLEDPLVDLLVEPAARACGLGALIQQVARAAVDVNRGEDESDPLLGGDDDAIIEIGPRAALGQGVVPRLMGGIEIYGRRLSTAAIERRLALYHRPFHRRLGEIVAAMRARHGAAAVLDCHSMPSTAGPGEPDRGQMRADVVLGDRHGTSASPALVEALAAAFKRRGYGVRANRPYAGGFIASHYGRPSEGLHALQIEFNRRLYMDEARFERGPGFATLIADLTAVLTELAAFPWADLRPCLPQAAE